MIIYCECCGVEIPEGTHCNECDPENGAEPYSFTMLVTNDREEFEERTQAKRTINLVTIAKAIKLCSIATAAYLYGVWLGRWYARENEPLLENLILSLLRSHRLTRNDEDAAARGFITGYKHTLNAMQEEEDERECWTHTNLLARYWHGE
jgi:hypothetical protein